MWCCKVSSSAIVAFQVAESKQSHQQIQLMTQECGTSANTEHDGLVCQEVGRYSYAKRRHLCCVDRLTCRIGGGTLHPAIVP